MDKGLAMVLGMTFAYVASFLGLLLAWRSWRKHHGKKSAPAGPARPGAEEPPK